MMKIVALMGSPHSGNTADKIQVIEEKLCGYGDVEFETINLMDLDLLPCKGCFMCFIKGDEHCPLKDDRGMLFDKLAAADGVIFASPVYSMHVSYLMKLFIDRFSCTFHRPCFFGKYAMGVAVAGNIGLKETLKYFESVASTWGFDYVGGVGYRAAPKHTPMRIPPLKKDMTDVVVGRFYQAIRENRPRKLTFSDYLMFRLMQVVYSRMESMSPFDYQYWKKQGWFDKETKFFCGNVKGNFLKDMVARFFAWIMGRQMDKEFAGL